MTSRQREDDPADPHTTHIQALADECIAVAYSHMIRSYLPTLLRKDFHHVLGRLELGFVFDSKNLFLLARVVGHRIWRVFLGNLRASRRQLMVRKRIALERVGNID